VLLALSVGGRDVRAQYVDLREGGRIRIQTATHPRWLYGRFVSFDTSGLRLNSCDTCEIRRVTLPQLRRFQASTGRTGRSFALEGAVLGVTIGAVLGRQTALPSHSTHPGEDLCSQRCAATVNTIEGAIVGIVIGTTIGAFLRREHWEPLLVGSGQHNR